MFNIKEILNEEYLKINNVFDCLVSSSSDNEIKKTEMETYSIRANNFIEDKMLVLSDDHIKTLKPLLDLPKSSIFLELGCGDGRFSLFLMNKGYNVIASDIAYGSIKKVEQVAKNNKIKNGNFCVVDAEKLPFKNNSLDGVLMVASLHHLPNSNNAIQEIFRVLKKDGKLLILKEPASWQYYCFYPIYKILRKIIRRGKNRPISIADDVTFGFSKRRINKMLKPYFEDISLVPVHYLKKYIQTILI